MSNKYVLLTLEGSEMQLWGPFDSEESAKQYQDEQGDKLAPGTILDIEEPCEFTEWVLQNCEEESSRWFDEHCKNAAKVNKEREDC